MPSLDLEKNLTFYGAYHHNQVNKGIHMIFVPLILMTGALLLSNTPAVIDLPYLPLNAGTIAALLYCTLYILMEPVAGGLVTPLILAGTAYGQHLLGEYGADANKYALALHLSSWVAQFIGHGKFEGRKPALLDNLFQSLFLAPFFVWFEVLFTLGYRPELRTRVDSAVVREIAKFRASQKAKSDVPLNDLNKNGKPVNGNAK